MIKEYLHYIEGMAIVSRPDDDSMVLDIDTPSGEALSDAEDLAKREGRKYLYHIVYGKCPESFSKTGLRLFISTPIFDIYRKVID